MGAIRTSALLMDNEANSVLKELEALKIPIPWDLRLDGSDSNEEIKTFEYVLKNRQRFVDWSSAYSSAPYCGLLTGHGPHDPTDMAWHSETPNVLEWFTFERFLAALDADHAAWDEKQVYANGVNQDTRAILIMLQQVLTGWPQVDTLLFPKRESRKPVWPPIHHALLHVYSRRCTGDASDTDVADLICKILQTALKMMVPLHSTYWSSVMPAFPSTRAEFSQAMTSALPLLAASSAAAASLSLPDPAAGRSLVSPLQARASLPPSVADADDDDVAMEDMTDDYCRPESARAIDAVPAAAVSQITARSVSRKSTGVTVPKVRDAIDQCGKESMEIQALKVCVAKHLSIDEVAKSTFNSALLVSRKFARNGKQIRLYTPEASIALEDGLGSQDEIGSS